MSSGTSAAQAQARVCAFPECIACTLASCVGKSPHRRLELLQQRFTDLIEKPQDPAFIEFCLHQLRTLAKSILLTPTSLAPTVSSPAHLVEGPQHGDVSLFEAMLPAAHPLTSKKASTDTSISSSTGSLVGTSCASLEVKEEQLLSPSSVDKQREIDLLFDAGIGKCLVGMIIFSGFAAVTSEMALNVLRDLILSNTRSEFASTWLLDTDSQGRRITGNAPLMWLAPELMEGSSTLFSSTVDVLTSFFGTTDIGRTLGERDMHAVISRLSLFTRKFTPQEFMESLSRYSDQYDLLGISQGQAEMYSQRWVHMIRDKAMLCMSTLVKSNCHNPPALEFIAKSRFTEEMLEPLASNLYVVPDAFPETDVQSNLLVTATILAPYFSADFRRELFKKLTHCLYYLMDEPLDVLMDKFHRLHDHVPPQLQSSPVRLHEAAQRALVVRAQVLSLLANSIRVFLAVPNRNEWIHETEVDAAFEILQRLVDACANDTESSVAPGGNTTTNTGKSARTQNAAALASQTVSKMLRCGTDRYPCLESPAGLDSALCAMIADNRAAAVSRFVLQNRANDAKAAARAAFRAGALGEAGMHFEVAAVLSGAMGAPVCGLLSSRAECLLAWSGGGDPHAGRLALAVASAAREACNPQHPHYPVTLRRIARARAAMEERAPASPLAQAYERPF